MPVAAHILLTGYWFKSNAILSFLYQTRGLHQQKEMVTTVTCHTTLSIAPEAPQKDAVRACKRQADQVKSSTAAF